MPAQDQSGLDTKTNPILKTSRIAAGILFLLLVIGVLFYAKKDFFAPQKVEVPEELILGEEIDSSDVRLEFPDLSKVDFVQYKTKETTQDLLKFYTDSFSNLGWTLEKSLQTQNSHQLVFVHKAKNLLVNIIVARSSDANQAIVGITYRKK